MNIDRKLLKPQVERRRRERMNRSLESLRALLLQGPQHQVLNQRRVEKSEILEHTVLFLQTTGDGNKKEVEGEEKQHHFRDGFSACLQRAAHFLGHEREGLHLEATLNTTFSARLNSHAGVGKAPAEFQSFNSLHSRKCPQSLPQMMIQDYCRQQLCTLYRSNHSHPYRVPLQHGDPNVPQHPQINVAKETQSKNLSASQSVWRPWP